VDEELRRRKAEEARSRQESVEEERRKREQLEAIRWQ
jgi:hypothetical protein